jgi:hypothetical protein
MSKVLVWKSDSDGHLFEDQQKYVKHLRKLARERIKIRKIAKMNAIRLEFIKIMGQVKSFTDLEKFIKDNWSWFFHNGLSHQLWGNVRRTRTEHQLDTITITGEWTPMLSNSHNCPIGGVTNWGGSPDKPRGYPGWKCRMACRIKTGAYTFRKMKFFEDMLGSDYFTETTLNTGTGSGGSPNDKGVSMCQYSLNLFADDFPGLKEAHDRAEVWNALGGQKLIFA